MRWVKDTLPPRERARWLLMTMRLSASSLAGTARTLVAVGTVSERFMFLTTAAAAPRSGDCAPPATGAVGFAAAGAAALAGAGAAGGGAAALGFGAGAACVSVGFVSAGFVSARFVSVGFAAAACAASCSGAGEA